MSSYTFSHKDLSIHFTRFGTGKTPLFAFHGFGRTGQDFDLFEPFLRNRFTVYAFDLFLHGESPFPEDRIEDHPITEKELQEFFVAFTNEYGIDDFSIMGYSLGGKISLSLLELFPKKVKEIYLLAPDGIILNRWYNFASRSTIGKALYRHIINYPNPYFILLKTSKAIGFIREKMYKFLMMNMETKQKRQLVYDIWLTFSLIKPNIPKIQKLIIGNNIQCHLFFGKHDNIIKPKIGEKFAKGIPNNSTFHIIECGHVLIRERTGKIIQQINETDL